MNDILPNINETKKCIAVKQCKHGTMVYPKNDVCVGRSLELYGEYSEGEWKIFEQLVKPGMVVVEVGSNIGAHTVPLAKMVGTKGFVFAYEPQRFLFHILCANIALNELTAVKTMQAAVGDKEGKIIVPVTDYSEEGNFGGVSLGLANAGEDVELKVIDNMDLPALHFLKIDVEGMEENVLRGAEKTITNYKPMIYVENDRVDKSASLIRYLKSLNYRMWWHCPFLYSSNNYFMNNEDIFSGVVSVNMICFHENDTVNINGLEEVLDCNAYPL